MKTTIELPDAIVQRAKILAAERQVTLRELVLQGLEHVLMEKQVTARERAKKLFAAMDQLPEFAAANRYSRSDAHAR
jgi:lipoprotein NlpI